MSIELTSKNILNRNSNEKGSIQSKHFYFNLIYVEESRHGRSTQLRSTHLQSWFMIYNNKCLSLQIENSNLFITSYEVSNVDFITWFNPKTYTYKYCVFESRPRSQPITRIYNNFAKLVANKYNEYLHKQSIGSQIRKSTVSFCQWCNTKEVIFSKRQCFYW